MIKKILYTSTLLFLGFLHSAVYANDITLSDIQAIPSTQETDVYAIPVIANRDFQISSLQGVISITNRQVVQMPDASFPAIVPGAINPEERIVSPDTLRFVYFYQQSGLGEQIAKGEILFCVLVQANGSLGDTTTVTLGDGDGLPFELSEKLTIVNQITRTPSTVTIANNNTNACTTLIDQSRIHDGITQATPSMEQDDTTQDDTTNQVEESDNTQDDTTNQVEESDSTEEKQEDTTQTPTTFVPSNTDYTLVRIAAQRIVKERSSSDIPVILRTLTKLSHHFAVPGKEREYRLLQELHTALQNL